MLMLTLCAAHEYFQNASADLRHIFAGPSWSADHTLKIP